MDASIWSMGQGSQQSDNLIKESITQSTRLEETMVLSKQQLSRSYHVAVTRVVPLHRSRSGKCHVALGRADFSCSFIPRTIWRLGCLYYDVPWRKLARTPERSSSSVWGVSCFLPRIHLSILYGSWYMRENQRPNLLLGRHLPPPTPHLTLTRYPNFRARSNLIGHPAVAPTWTRIQAWSKSIVDPIYLP